MQSFKKAGAAGQHRRSGGQQYTYRCPDCRGPRPSAGTARGRRHRLGAPGRTIGDRSKALAPNTMERIRRGLVKYGPHLLAGQGNTWDGVNTGFGLHPGVAAHRSHPGAGVPFPARRSAPPDDAHVMCLCARNAEARPASVAPLQTVAAGGQHHGLVMAPQSQRPGAPRRDRPYAGDDHARAPPTSSSPTTATAEARPDTEPHGTVHHQGPGGRRSVAVKIEDCHYRVLDAHEVQAAMAFPGTTPCPARSPRPRR